MNLDFWNQTSLYQKHESKLSVYVMHVLNSNKKCGQK